MLHTRTIEEHAKALRRREYSSVELTNYFLERANKHQNLNAFITLAEDVALSQAKEADSRLSKGDSSPLLGIPLAIKDVFCTKNILTTCASKMLSNFTAPYDATVVELMNKAGSVMIGKTNMDEFAMGSTTESSYYGASKNPWNTSYVPGGSSGGSSVSVAAGLAPAALGSDTGGSVRQPAAFCGVTGIKPSYGRISRYGLIAFASSMDQAGFITRSAADASILIDAATGLDVKDATSIDVPPTNTYTKINTKTTKLKAGIPKEFLSQGVDAEVGSAVESAISIMEEMGIEIVPVSLPNIHLGVPCYYVLSSAEASSNLARYDGVRYGYRSAQHTNLEELYSYTRSEGFGDEVQRRIMIGTYVLSSGYYDAYYLKAQKIRRIIANDYARAFEKCDFIAGPTTPTTAFKIGENQNNPTAVYLNDIFTSVVNLAGLPAISIPIGFSCLNMPIGMQLIGNHLEEDLILAVSHQYQQRTDWHMKFNEEQ